MAVIMNADKLYQTLEALFGKDSQQVHKAKALNTSGAKVAFGLFNFTAKVGDEVYACKLPTMSMHLLTPSAMQPGEVAQAKTQVGNVIESAFQSSVGLTVLTPVQDPDGTSPEPNFGQPLPPKKVTPQFMNTPPSQKEVNAAMAAAAAKPVSGVSSNKPVNSVVPLSKAEAVGQKVKGTSHTSVYQCFAVGTVNLAARIGVGSVSVRAEPHTLQTFPPVVKQRLAEVGFSDYGSYMSVHLNLADVPAMRALGAIVFSMDTSFTEVATNLGAMTNV